MKLGSNTDDPLFCIRMNRSSSTSHNNSTPIYRFILTETLPRTSTSTTCCPIVMSLYSVMVLPLLLPATAERRGIGFISHPIPKFCQCGAIQLVPSCC